MTELAHRIDALVRGIPGVVALYDATPLPRRIAGNTVGLLRGDTAGASASPVSVIEEESRLEVAVSIGVADGASATAVSRRVYDAIVAEFGGPAPARSITVRVSSIG